MNEFLTLVTPEQAMDTWLAQIHPKIEIELVQSENAAGRVLMEPIGADHDLPEFTRSTVDGYAVRARDTFGASSSLPAYLSLVGEIGMGSAPAFPLEPTQTALIHTGGMLPEGADAVVMVENTQLAGEAEIEIFRAVAAGENVIYKGEDVKSGQEVIPPGSLLRPAEIGGLMALGKTEVRVARKPVVAILSSGDEVVPPSERPVAGQVRDINTYSLQALVRKLGGEPVSFGIVPDNEADFKQAAETALQSSDLVLFTAGSSVSARDLTARTINSLGRPGIVVHGISIRPGKPTILAVCGGKPVVGLPGNPVSALVIAGLFVRPMMDKLRGMVKPGYPAAVPAFLGLNLSSQAGREDWVPVRLVLVGERLQAEPVFGKSNLIFSLAAADGLVRIPPEANGLPAGASVQVHLI